MAKKRVFISFDYDHDRNYRYLLNALNENTRSPIEFEDITPSEIDSNDISRVKAVLTKKIRDSSHTLVLIGKHANESHKDSAKIGTRNWQWWEIERSIAEGKNLIAVKLDRLNQSPEPIINVGAAWIMSFNVDDIREAINKV